MTASAVFFVISLLCIAVHFIVKDPAGEDKKDLVERAASSMKSIQKATGKLTIRFPTCGTANWPAAGPAPTIPPTKRCVSGKRFRSAMRKVKKTTVSMWKTTGF